MAHRCKYIGNCVILINNRLRQPLPYQPVPYHLIITYLMNSYNKNLVPGAILMLIGFLFLADNYNWFSFDWHTVFRLWPLAIIMLGINMIVGKRSSAATGLTIALIAICVPIAMLKGVKRDVEDRFEWFRNDDDHNNRSNEKSAENDSDMSEKKQNFSESMESSLETATLHLAGGATKFTIGGGTSDLISADAKMTGNFPEYALNKKVNGSNADLELKAKEGKDGEGIHFNMDENDDTNIDIKNQLDVKINEKPQWSLDIELGAGKADIDLSTLIVKKISLKTGVASTEIKLGDKADKTEVTVESGVAEVEISVPKGVGCRLETKDAALNMNDFDGFTKNGSSYETANFQGSKKQIVISFKSGLSKLKVNRY
jgi:Domain of unknown function (DUF5668)